jgi:hypothetical protein
VRSPEKKITSRAVPIEIGNRYSIFHPKSESKNPDRGTQLRGIRLDGDR